VISLSAPRRSGAGLSAPRRSGAPIRRGGAALALAALAGAGAGCSGSSTSSGATTTAAPATTTGTAAPTTVSVTMKEWTVEPDRTTAAPGPVTFQVINKGGKTHELVLFKTDLAPDKLPLDDEGAVDERAAGVELVEEVEDVAAGETKSFSADAVAGNYYLVCNLVDPDTGEKHFEHQMYVAFKVA
jgi:hypothetical protein